MTKKAKKAKNILTGGEKRQYNSGVVAKTGNGKSEPVPGGTTAAMRLSLNTTVKYKQLVYIFKVSVQKTACKKIQKKLKKVLDKRLAV